MSTTVVIVSPVSPTLLSNEVYVAVGPNMKSELQSIVENHPINEIKCMGGYIPEEDDQADIYEVMKPNSKLLIAGLSTREQGQSIIVDLKICGFVHTLAATDPAVGERFIVCQKPEPLGSVAAVKLPTSSNKGVSEVKKWKMDLDDLADSDLIDESELKDDIVVPEPEDCGPGVAGKKRACANCSCGLAEIQSMEEKSGVSIDSDVQVNKSACGGCSKGDAFRCVGCPFLGKPAFEPGQEKLVLSLGMDDI